ncbi:MAG: hypothetical protein GTN80_08225, partial [Nitrososphaeria archaeon]|nr:hypothetical protein [Nitrososphaeria archaeon]NIQ33609.1 hypothetical protein [Nitrososphaeria archaeon]
QFDKVDGDTDDDDGGDKEPEPEPTPEPEPEPDDDKKKKKEPTQAAGEDKDKDKPSSLDEAALLELLPEKFRGEDFAESLKKLTGAYGEVESEHGSTKQELAQATRILKGLGQQYAPRPVTPPPAAPAAAPAAPEAAPEISPEEEKALNAILQNVDILEDPVTPLKNIYLLAKRVAQNEADQRVLHYDAVRQRVDQFNRFKAEHPDLEEHRPEMLEILQANPYLDNPESVELVYNKAKELKQARQVASVKETTEQVVSNDQFTDFLKKREAEIEKRVRAEFEEKIQQGQAMKGTLDSGSTPTVTPKEKLDKKDAGKNKRIIIKTDHGDFVTDDPELAGIITAERHEDRGLLNL